MTFSRIALKLFLNERKFELNGRNRCGVIDEISLKLYDDQWIDFSWAIRFALRDAKIKNMMRRELSE